MINNTESKFNNINKVNYLKKNSSKSSKNNTYISDYQNHNFR